MEKRAKLAQKSHAAPSFVAQAPIDAKRRFLEKDDTLITVSTPSCPVNVKTYYCAKGGCGKTSFCYHAAMNCATTKPDEDVLLLDFDPQGCLTNHLLGVEAYQAICDAQTNFFKPSSLFHWLADVASAKADSQIPPVSLASILENSTRIIAKRRLASDAVCPLVPTNVQIISCGSRIVDIDHDFYEKARQRSFVYSQEEVWAWMYSRLAHSLQEYANRKENTERKKLNVFIDCNPMFMCYVGVCLVASNEWIIPTTNGHNETIIAKTSLDYVFEDTKIHSSFAAQSKNLKVALPPLITILSSHGSAQPFKDLIQSRYGDNIAQFNIQTTQTLKHLTEK